MQTTTRYAYKLGEEIKPSIKLRTYNLIGSLLTLFMIMLFVIPVVLFAPLVVTAVILVLTILVMVPIFLWVSLYYRSISYRFTETEMIWKRGVWFRATGIVPYTKVTNVDMVQGPLMRALGIATLRVQTAGYNAASGPTSELKIEGVVEHEALRELIMSYVRDQKAAVPSPVPISDDRRMLEELVKIRQLLERQGGRP
jgi:membrane protein YdbS with pleckstrin-like domain